jgi:hypothetical protein
MFSFRGFIYGQKQTPRKGENPNIRPLYRSEHIYRYSMYGYVTLYECSILYAYIDIPNLSQPTSINGEDYDSV